MQDLSHINNAINSNRNMFAQMSQPSITSNKSHLVNSYYGDKVIYYNDEAALKKEKNKKRNKILTLAFTGIATLGIAGTLITGILKGKIKPNQIGHQVAESKLGKKAAKILEPVVNASVNFSNIKDDLWTRYTSKNKYLNKANTFLENIYHGFAKNKYKASYDKNYKIVTEGLGDIKGVKNFDGWFDDILAGIKTNLGLDGKGKHITEGLLSGLKENPKGTLARLGKDLTGTPLSEQRLGDVRAKQIKELIIDGIGKLSDDLYDEDPVKAQKALEDLASKIQKSGKLKDGKDPLEVAKAVRDLNRIKTKGGNDLFERVRDTALGNAATDTLGVIGALGLLGGSLATAEDKAERKSTMVNLGIPLLVTLGSMVYGTAMCFSGGVALAFGLVTGEVAKRGAKMIDNKMKQNATLKAENEKKEFLA